MGFCMALSMNSVGIPGGFRGNAGFSGKFGVSGDFGRFGGSKGFCANSHFQPRLWVLFCLLSVQNSCVVVLCDLNGPEDFARKVGQNSS